MSYQDQNDLKFSSDLSRFLKAIGYLFFIFLLVGVLFITLGCFRISSYAFKTYESIDKIPYNHVGVLFGTSPLDSNGEPNDYFNYRIMAASQLFKAGKVDYILVSGDNQHHSYNEPRFMRKALVKAGVPSDRIVFDFAGIRTLDSVVRARKVFLQQSVTFISQDFQNERALFIADHNDLKAVGFNALKPARSFFNRVGIREFFARIVCVFDVYVLDTQPKFLGKPESIGKSSMPKELSNKPKRMTSAIKRLTDNAKIVRENQLIAKYEPLAKKPSDNAFILKSNLERLARLAALRDEEEAASNNQLEELLNEQQEQALEKASETASESLNAGNNNTYIDPSSDPALVKNKPATTTQKKVVKKRNYAPDPWD